MSLRCAQPGRKLGECSDKVFYGSLRVVKKGRGIKDKIDWIGFEGVSNI